KEELDYKNMEVRNLYGPSEDTTYSTVYRFEDDQLNYIPIGIPVGDTQLYILGDNQQLLPIGVEGEICLSGESTAIGYYNKPELTDAAFVENPFVAGKRMYKTGDIGKWSPTGQVIYSGRKDDQVKIRGYRIELGEIEYQIERLEQIQQAVVLVKEIGGEREIVAYYQEVTATSIEEIKAKLSAQLPSYMVPHIFIALEEIPLNSNGKVDKKALPEPDGSAMSTAEYVAARNEIEEELVSIWEEVLQREKIGVLDDFFELGGHSLKATRVISKVQEKFEVTIDLKNLFINPTIEHLSNYVETLKWMDDKNEEELESEQDEFIL
ncbi:MAG: AMP-binding protein, partial [Crocinitomix sp.]|nr:AMP-binding protein [Crocinitomix sp.]